MCFIKYIFPTANDATKNIKIKLPKEYLFKLRKCIRWECEHGSSSYRDLFPPDFSEAEENEIKLFLEKKGYSVKFKRYSSGILSEIEVKWGKEGDK